MRHSFFVITALTVLVVPWPLPASPPPATAPRAQSPPRATAPRFESPPPDTGPRAQGLPPDTGPRAPSPPPDTGPRTLRPSQQGLPDGETTQGKLPVRLPIERPQATRYSQEAPPTPQRKRSLRRAPDPANTEASKKSKIARPRSNQVPSGKAPLTPATGRLAAPQAPPADTSSLAASTKKNSENGDRIEQLHMERLPELTVEVRYGLASGSLQAGYLTLLIDTNTRLRGRSIVGATAGFQLDRPGDDRMHTFQLLYELPGAPALDFGKRSAVLPRYTPPDELPADPRPGIWALTGLLLLGVNLLGYLLLRRPARWAIAAPADAAGPPETSTALLRWRLDRALLMLKLPDPRGVYHPLARQELRALSDSPLLEEVQTRGGELAASGSLLGPRRWMSARGLLGVAALALLNAVLPIAVLGWEGWRRPPRIIRNAGQLAVRHQQDAARLDLDLFSLLHDVRGDCEVYLDGKPDLIRLAKGSRQNDRTIWSLRGAVVAASTSGTGHWVQARIPLLYGDIGFSNPVWLPPLPKPLSTPPGSKDPKNDDRGGSGAGALPQTSGPAGE